MQITLLSIANNQPHNHQPLCYWGVHCKHEAITFLFTTCIYCIWQSARRFHALCCHLPAAHKTMQPIIILSTKHWVSWHTFGKCYWLRCSLRCVFTVEMSYLPPGDAPRQLCLSCSSIEQYWHCICQILLSACKILKVQQEVNIVSTSC